MAKCVGIIEVHRLLRFATTIEFFTLRHLWQNLAGSNKFCQIWQVNVSVEKSNILEKCNRLEKSKDLDNSYFIIFL